MLVFGMALAAEDRAQRGAELYRQRDFSGAAWELKQALAANPKNLRARVDLARTFIQLNQVPQALKELKAALAHHPGDGEAEFQVGKVLQELAASRFARMQRAAPDSAELRELLGRQYEAQGNVEQALTEYRAALERDRARAGVRFLIGNALWKNGDHDGALQELLEELRSNPNHTLANYRSGQILLGAGEVERAIQHLSRAVVGNPKLLEARRELGKAYRQADRFPEALKELRWVADARPQDNSVHAQLAAVYKAMGDEEQAKKELEIHREILSKKHRAVRENFEKSR